MAPKAKRASGAAKAAAGKAKAKAKAAPQAAAVSALDLPDAKRRRQLNRRSTREQAERALRQHLPGVPQDRVRSTTDSEGIGAHGACVGICGQLGKDPPMLWSANTVAHTETVSVHI